MGSLLDGLILATASVHVFLAPYTKVEESFNLHATHDVLMHGIGPSTLPNYDHFVFSGAVPRSFIGSVLLAYISKPVLYAANYFELVHSKADIQLIVRLVLATFNALIICLIRRAVSRRFGYSTSVMFTILSCTQFHLPFWMGRTLPNMFALIPVNISSYLLLNLQPNAIRPSTGNVRGAITLLTFTAVVFRSEVALLLAPICLQTLLNGSITFGGLVRTGVIAGLSSIALTVLIDSYFWSQWPLWPELYGLYFNVYQGKSSEWGISPPHTYFTSYLPKLLLSSLPLAVLSLFLPSSPRNRTWPTLLPHILFVLGLSALGHKEWRFVVYVVPTFNVAAARGARWLTTRRISTFFGRLCHLAFLGFIAINIAATFILALSSMANYPGGVALATFNEMYANETNVHVHLSNLAAQTGASLFLQTHAPPYPSFLPHLEASTSTTSWTYDKTENLTLSDLTSNRRITHLIAETPAAGGKGWKVAGTVEGFRRWDVDRRFVADLRSGRLLGEKGVVGVWERVTGVVRMEKEEMLWILERTS